MERETRSMVTSVLTKYLDGQTVGCEGINVRDVEGEEERQEKDRRKTGERQKRERE